MRIKTAIWLAAMMLCSSCENYQKNPVPNFPVSIDLNLAAEYPHFMLDNGYQTIVFNEPRFVHEYVGYAGIVVVCGMDHAYHAFDLCCPVCLNRDTVVEIDGLKAICPKCGESYDLSYGFAVPEKGISRYALKPYSCSYGGGHLIIRN
ncbi:MAG: FYDLN acid domain-containing protein [Paludibacteraceae bacterium]|nr:FYDLN acid domain-containing protein [Paludibacteraceae bacterium]